jgi:hypothetical protein
MIYACFVWTSGANSVQSITQTSQTFVHQRTITFNPTGAPTHKIDCELWTAPRVGTVTAAATVQLVAAADSITLLETGLAGVNSTSSPMDTNGGLPVQTGVSATTVLSAPVFTNTEANDQIFAVGFNTSSTATANCATTSTWSTTIGCSGNFHTAVVNTALTFINHPVTTIQSGVTADIAGVSTNSNAWLAFVDSFTADAPPAGNTVHTLGATGAGN